jgi:hypothetical protein
MVIRQGRILRRQVDVMAAFAKKGVIGERQSLVSCLTDGIFGHESGQGQHSITVQNITAMGAIGRIVNPVFGSNNFADLHWINPDIPLFSRQDANNGGAAYGCLGQHLPDESWISKRFSNI